MTAPIALVTGFGAFAGYRDNPSERIARSLDGTQVGSVHIAGAVLPVDFARFDKVLRRAIVRTRPVAVIALGLAGGATAIRLERFAVNLAAFDTPDNAGRVVAGEKLADDGLDALASRLPLDAIHADLARAGIPAVLSNSAGTYLCNAAMYRLLHLLPLDAACGFIHLPHLPAEAVRLAGGPGREPPPSMPFELQREAVLAALRRTLGMTREKP